MTRRSRRSMLAACGAGLAALAGCGEVDVDMGGSDEREYDASALSTIVEGEEAPTRPDAFPVRVDEELVERHYDRARELVAAVPERPDVPNGAVAEELRRRRERVADDREDPRDATTGLRRLDSARRVRSEAAEVNGAYHAAVGDVDPERVTESREVFRADLHTFEGERNYRGEAPAPALVVHAELERLVRAARRKAEAWPPLPDDPRDDVFRVGEILGNLEAGWATFADADRLRTRYLEGTDDERSFRPAITAAAHRLDQRVSVERRRVHDFLDTPAAEAFERSVEETPAAHLYEDARRNAERAADDAELSRRTDDHAVATLESARRLAGLRAFGATIEAIEAGEYGRPEDAEPVATARSEAVAALREAWETDPNAVSVEVAEPAHEALSSGHFRLEDADGEAYEVDDALASFAYARLYAEAVPDTVGSVVAALEDDQ